MMLNENPKNPKPHPEFDAKPYVDAYAAYTKDCGRITSNAEFLRRLNSPDESVRIAASQIAAVAMNFLHNFSGVIAQKMKEIGSSMSDGGKPFEVAELAVPCNCPECKAKNERIHLN